MKQKSKRGKALTADQREARTAKNRRRRWTLKAGHVREQKSLKFQRYGVQTTDTIDQADRYPDREFPCMSCETGEYKNDGGTSPSGQQTYKCTDCGDKVSFP